jgi:hypothetical protein
LNIYRVLSLRLETIPVALAKNLNTQHFFGGLTNTAKVLDISYPYASHISTGRRRLSPILCYKIKKATRGKFDFVNITVLKKYCH